MNIWNRSKAITSETHFEGRNSSNHPAAPKRIGLAISSGGAKGLAHVGVIQVLEENQIPIAAVAGSSMGAYVGALWCAGYNGKQLRNLAEEIHSPKKLRQLSDLAFPPTKGLFKGLKAKANLRGSIGDITFEQLSRSFYVVTTDIETQQRIVCKSGKVIDAVHASCAMPGVIIPVHYRNRRCVDGGVVDPVPVSVLTKYANVDAVIAISTIPTIDEIDHCPVEVTLDPNKNIFRRTVRRILHPINLLGRGNIVDTFTSSLKASQVRMAHDSCKRADLVIKPISCTGRWYDYHQYDHFIKVGRKAAEDALPQIKELLSPKLSNEPKANHLVGKSLSR